MQKKIEQIYAQVEKHKRATLYTFFDILEDLNLKEITRLNDTQSCVRFEENKCVIYDERILVMEQTFQKYLAWFNQNVQKELPFYRKKILVYNECSFAEFLEKQTWSDDTDEKYYQRLGSMAALVPTLGGRELRTQDIRRVGEYPIPCDVISLYKNGYSYCKDISEYPTHFAALQHTKNNAYQWLFEGYRKSYLFCQENSADVKELIKIYQPQ